MGDTSDSGSSTDDEDLKEIVKNVLGDMRKSRSDSSHSSNDTPLNIQVEEISRKSKSNPTLRSSNKVEKKARRQSFSYTKVLPKQKSVKKSIEIHKRGRKWSHDKCLNMHIFHVIYTTSSMKFHTCSTKLVLNFILSLTMESNCVLGSKKQILRRFKANQTKIQFFRTSQ